MTGRIYLIVSFVLIFILTVFLFFLWRMPAALAPVFFAPRPPAEPIGRTEIEDLGQDIEIIATDLEIPWSLAFLADGGILATERPGRLSRLRADDTPLTIAEFDDILHLGEGGLLGLALHPDFPENNWLYLYKTTRVGSRVENSVERYHLENGELSDRTIILDGISGSQYHDGGYLAFGPDKKLYITTGDAGRPNDAQRLDSLAGKILRLNDDGTQPDDNPFGSLVYSYGHRNPQGLAWDDKGRLWATEHGRSGLRSGLDELNLIIPGGNYGWPLIEGDEERAEMVSPWVHSGPDVTWAPAGAVFWDGSIFFSGLRGESLYEAVLLKGEAADEKLEVISHFFGRFGRLRALTLGPDGFFYLSTSNTDGRGRISDGDDKIIKINPRIFRGQN